MSRAHVSRRLRPLAAAAVLLCAAAPARALECPVPHPEAAGNVLRETQGQMAQYSSMLGNGDMGNAISEIVTELRKRHPDATGPEIVNFLVAIYCPALAAQGYGGDVAKSKIGEFIKLVEDRVLNGADSSSNTSAHSG